MMLKMKLTRGGFECMMLYGTLCFIFTYEKHGGWKWMKIKMKIYIINN